MNVIDENISNVQVDVLKGWRIPVRQIGSDIGWKGMSDTDIISLLCRLRRRIFFTRDNDFYKRSLCHSQYCLVYMGIEQFEVAFFVRRLLHHYEFDAQAKRMGTVIRLSPSGLTVWRLHAEKEISFTW